MACFPKMPESMETAAKAGVLHLAMLVSEKCLRKDLLVVDGKNRGKKPTQLGTSEGVGVMCVLLGFVSDTGSFQKDHMFG